MKNILFNNKKNETVSYKYLDNIKTCGCRVGMRAVNGKLIIQLEWPNGKQCPSAPGFKLRWGSKKPLN